jgi:hypothetical protein
MLILHKSPEKYPALPGSDKSHEKYPALPGSDKLPQSLAILLCFSTQNCNRIWQARKILKSNFKTQPFLVTFSPLTGLK